MEIVAVLVVGLFAGALGGLFGVGGGLIFVPTLVLLVGLGQVDAEATSLLAILPVVIAGTWRQHLYGNVRWRTAAIIGTDRSRRHRAWRADGQRTAGGDAAAPLRGPRAHSGRTARLARAPHDLGYARVASETR